MTKNWDKLQYKLKERHAHLKDVLDLSTQYYDVLQKLSDWLPVAMETVESWPPVSAQPQQIAEQRAEVETLEAVVSEKQPLVAEAARLCHELCDQAKEGSTKFDLKNKLNSVERPVKDIVKKIGKQT